MYLKSLHNTKYITKVITNIVTTLKWQELRIKETLSMPNSINKWKFMIFFLVKHFWRYYPVSLILALGHNLLIYKYYITKLMESDILQKIKQNITWNKLYTEKI